MLEGYKTLTELVNVFLKTVDKYKEPEENKYRLLSL